MSALTETSLTDMKAAFPPAPDLIQGIPTLQSLIELLFLMCCYAQMHRSPASKKINLLDVSRLERYRTNVLLVRLTKVRC